MSTRTRSRVRSLAALLVVGAALVGCPAAAADPPPADYSPGEVYRDPQGRFTLTPPAGWAHHPGDPYAPRPPAHSHTGQGPSAPEAAFVDRGAPDGDTVHPRIDVRVSEWARDLRTAVESNRVTGPYGWESLTVDEPVLLADGTPAHVLAGTLPPAGTASAPDRGRTVLLAVSGGSLFEVEVEVDGDDAGRYGPGFFEAALRTLTVAGDPPPGPWPWPPERYTDPAGRFSLLVPPRFELDPAHQDPDEAAFFDPAAPELAQEVKHAPELRVYVDRTLKITLPEVVAVTRLQFANDTDLLVVDEPLVLADGTPAHLLAGVDTDAGASGVQTTLLLAVRDGVVHAVLARVDRALLSAYPPEVFEASARSLTLAG